MNELFEIPGMKNIGNDNIVKRSANAKVAKSTFDNEIRIIVCLKINPYISVSDINHFFKDFR